MKVFKLTGEATFEAESLDHAFLLLAKHFMDLSLGLDSELFTPETTISVQAIRADPPGVNAP